MKSLKIKLIIAIMTILNFSCFTTQKSYELYKEGFFGEELYVYITDTFSLEAEKKGVKLEEFILKSAQVRASKFLASYISLNINSRGISQESDLILNKSITTSLNSGKVTFMECTDSYYCSAEIVFNTAPVINALSKINANSKVLKE